MSGIFKRLRLHGLIERVKGTYKYVPTAYGKELIAASLTVVKLILATALAEAFLSRFRQHLNQSV